VLEWTNMGIEAKLLFLYLRLYAKHETGNWYKTKAFQRELLKLLHVNDVEYTIKNSWYYFSWDYNCTELPYDWIIATDKELELLFKYVYLHKEAFSKVIIAPSEWTTWLHMFEANAYEVTLKNQRIVFVGKKANANEANANEANASECLERVQDVPTTTVDSLFST